MCFLSSNISVFPRKATFSISRPDTNFARLNWAENRLFSFDSHVAFLEHRKVSCNLIIKLLPSLFLTRNLCKATAKNMAACSFKAIIVGGPCSYDRRDQSKSVNEGPLLSCVKDIERHKSLWSFTEVTGEQEFNSFF